MNTKKSACMAGARCEVPMVAMEGVYSKTVARFGSFNRESGFGSVERDDSGPEVA